MGTILVRKDAASLYWRGMGRSGDWTPSYHEWGFRRTLEAIQGQTVTLVGPVESGVGNCLYGRLPDAVKEFKSRVIALQPEWVERVDPSDAEKPPVEARSAAGNENWWEKEGRDIVRVLTTWVDGFMAFTPQ